MLTGEKVRLRAYTKDDLETARAHINDPRVARCLNPGIPFPYRPEDELKWYDSFNPHGDGVYHFAIEPLEAPRYIGGCGINQVDAKNRRAVVGIFIAHDFCGQGYGTDAMRVLVRFCFEQMNLNKVALGVFAFNERAIKSYEKVGFQVDGRLRQQVFRDGQYHDEILMSLLRVDWQQDSS